jgi:phosphoserine phosphatase RsbU/P
VALLDQNNHLILGANRGISEETLKDWDYYQNSKAQGLESVSETSLPDQKTTVLASISPVGIGGLLVLSYLPKELALEASKILVQKSFLFLIAILSFGTLLSFFASREITRSLTKLSLATEKVASGDFNVKVEVDYRDEVGTLARGFNQMAAEVSRLMVENTDRVRMEKELETARTVQETLFPALDFDSTAMRLRAYYQPATECCGDWWHYTKTDDSVYFWIGDATGHGVPAALITSAACSAVSLIERQPNLKVSNAMAGLDLAIRSTSKGKVLMSFFCGRLNEQTGVLSYSNAAHNFPFWVKNTVETPTRKNILRLNEAVHSHLGGADSQRFNEFELQLTPGDMLVFYTDGLTELKNAAGELLGDKKVIQTILSAIQTDFKLENVLESIQREVAAFKGDTPLDDDLTVFIVQYQPTTV